MYVENTDVDIAATKLREKFDALSLPDGCGSPVILNINVSEMMPSAIVGLLGDDLAALQQQAENVVAPALERIDGVASVSVSRRCCGASDHRDARRAARRGLRPLHELHHTDPAGGEPALIPPARSTNGSQKLSVTTDAQLSRSDEVANINIPLQTAARCASARSPTSPSRPPTADAIAANGRYARHHPTGQQALRRERGQDRRGGGCGDGGAGGEGRLHPLRHPLCRERIHQRRRRRRARGASSSASCSRRSWCGCSCAAAAARP